MKNHGAKLRTFAAGVAFSVLAAGASAGTIDLTYKGTLVDAADRKTVRITQTPSGVAPAADHVYAFAFMMEGPAATSLERFVAWCLDIEAFVGSRNQSYRYTTTSNPFSNSFGLDADQRERVHHVFEASYGGLDLTQGAMVAGFQLALWEALYDDDWNVSTGEFQATSGASEVISMANDHLAAAKNFMGPRTFNMTFLESAPEGSETRKQNLVTATPVPLPAAGLLFLSALGGLAALRRRKRTA